MRLIKRKKGNQEYFYLQHSFRKNGKVQTRERYIGSKLPKDIEDIKKEFMQKETKELENKLKQIKENFQKEWRKTPNSAKEKQFQEISISFTYNTNAIEGSTITLEETREIIEEQKAPNKPLKDVKETEAHSQVFLEMLKKKQKITSNLILEWHKKIFSSTKKDIAGGYRDYLVRVADYVAPDWQDVKKLMNQFIKHLNKSKENPIIKAAKFHYQFEKIHPFGDGNGRIGRLIINHILWHSGYPMIIIEYKKRKSYYQAFKRDEQRFIKYFIRRYLSVHKKRVN